MKKKYIDKIGKKKRTEEEEKSRILLLDLLGRRETTRLQKLRRYKKLFQSREKFGHLNKDQVIAYLDKSIQKEIDLGQQEEKV